MRLTWKAIVVAAGVLGLAGAIRWGAQLQRAARAESSEAPFPAVSEVVAPGATEGASDVVELSFDVAGTIAEVGVDESDPVHAGQVLARLDDRLARAHVAQAEATLLAARAGFDMAVHGSRPMEVAAAEADEQAAEAEAVESRAEKERDAKLFALSAVSRAESDHIGAVADAAIARAAAAQARLALTKAGSREEIRREAHARVDQASAALEEAQVLLSKTALTAPCDGVILRRLANPGERSVDIGPRPIITLVDRSRLRVRAEVDEEDIGRVHVGQAGYATARTYGATRFAGKVTRLSGQLGRRKVINDDPRAREDTRVLEVIFELSGAADLPIGLRMDVHLPER